MICNVVSDPLHKQQGNKDLLLVECAVGVNHVSGDGKLVSDAKLESDLVDPLLPFVKDSCWFWWRCELLWLQVCFLSKRC